MNLDWVLTGWAAVYTLAAYRLTRLLTHDSLPPVKRVRDYVLNRWGDNPWSEIADCPWCMGWWVALGTTLLVSSPADTVYRWVAVPLAMSTIIGLIANRDG
jgi:hypothetical protein